MGAFRPSARQAYAASAWMPGMPAASLPHIVLPGPYGSGKSAVAVRSLLTWAVCALDGEHEIAVCAKTRTQMSEMLQTQARAWAAEHGVSVAFTPQRWRILSDRLDLTVLCVVFGERGAVSPAERVQGTNLSGLLVDEAVNMNARMRSQLLARLRVGAMPRSWWTCNPEGPRHPFKTQFIDADEFPSWSFTLMASDNPSLPAGYIAQLEASLPHAWQRDRYIRGLWVAPSGLVYPHAWMRIDAGGNVAAPGDRVFASYTAGVDWATRTITHAVLVGTDHLGHCVIDEWVHDAREEGELTVEQQAAGMIARFQGDPPRRSVRSWTVDQTAKGLTLALAQQQPSSVVRESSMRVLDGVNLVAKLLAERTLTVSPTCERLISEMENYSWPDDERAWETYGDLKPVKADDHGVDALRYWAETNSAYTVPRRRTARVTGARID